MPAKGRLRLRLAALAVLLSCVAAPATAEAADRDHDGLSDRYERRHSHTAPTRADTDRDRLGDRVEVRRQHTNPRRADTDRDGLADGDEVHPLRRYRSQSRRYRGQGRPSWSNPLRRDTDRDRLSDRRERRHGTTPTVRDSDGDGLDDGYELRRLGTSPLSGDSDGDGLDDGYELRRLGTSPLTGDSDGDGLSDGFEAMLGSNARDRRSPGGGPAPAQPGPAPVQPGPVPLAPPGRPETLPVDPRGGEPQEPGNPPVDPPGGAPQEPGNPPVDPPGGEPQEPGNPPVDPPGGEPQEPGNPPDEPDEPGPPPPGGGSCTTVAASVSEARSQVSAAASGSTVCLANGTYGSLELSGTKTSPGVTLRAQNPGGATVGGVDISGRFLTLRGLIVDGSVEIAANSRDITVDRNDITSGGLAVFVYGDRGMVSNVLIAGNRISGLGAAASGQNDVIRLHNFRGVRIEGNELRNIDERGETHSDILQTVHGGAGLVFARNYVHEQQATQGFFVKDGAVTNVTVEENLIVDDPSGRGYSISVYDTHPNPADPYYTGYGSLIRRNTVWNERTGVAIRGCDHEAVLVEQNVLSALGHPGADCSLYTSIGNAIGANPGFVDEAGGDYRLASGTAGISWRLADQHYGP